MSKTAVDPQEQRRAEIDQVQAQLQKSFGANASRRGGLRRARQVVPTGSLALDFELGIGGWPLGSISCVYGFRDIGKSSMVGFNAAKNAIGMGLNTAWVALERFDEDWAETNGVPVDDLLLSYPENGEEAFGMILKQVQSGKINFLIFDSIGAVLSEKEMDEDGKPRMGGQAGLITWFSKAVAPMARKNNVGIILLNQARANMNYPGAIQQPGGYALEHMSDIIVQIRRGKAKYTVREAGTDVQVGQEVVAVIQRNKTSQGTGKKAHFDYFFAETDKYPFGIDTWSDVINTAKRTGVIVQRGAMYDLPNGKTLKGWDSVIEYLEKQPDVVDIIREGVLTVMATKTSPAEPEKE